jgi:hypothetical protein
MGIDKVLLRFGHKATDFSTSLPPNIERFIQQVYKLSQIYREKLPVQLDLEAGQWKGFVKQYIEKVTEPYLYLSLARPGRQIIANIPIRPPRILFLWNHTQGGALASNSEQYYRTVKVLDELLPYKRFTGIDSLADPYKITNHAEALRSLQNRLGLPFFQTIREHPADAKRHVIRAFRINGPKGPVTLGAQYFPIEGVEKQHIKLWKEGSLTGPLDNTSGILKLMFDEQEPNYLKKVLDPLPGSEVTKELMDCLHKMSINLELEKKKPPVKILKG